MSIKLKQKREKALMSEDFNNIDYSDYFKALEERLSNDSPRSAEKETPEPKTVPQKKRKKKAKGIRPLVLVAVILIALIVVSVTRKPSTPDDSVSKDSVSDATDTPIKTEKPVNGFKKTKDTEKIPSTNDSESAIVIDLKTRKIIAERNYKKKLYPASTTKIMTLLVAAENIENLNDTFTMTRDITDPLFIAEATVAGFLIDETITLKDMLYGLILPSGADAAVGLATKIAGDEAAFVQLMNEKVEKLGLKNTHFTNTSGLFHKDHYSTVYDMAIILEEAMKSPLCREVLSTYQYTTSKTPQHEEGILLSSTLFTYMKGTEPETATITGGKTGFVNESGYCIASFGQNNLNGNEYIVVTFKNSSKWPAFYGQIDLYKQFAK